MCLNSAHRVTGCDATCLGWLLHGALAPPTARVFSDFRTSSISESTSNASASCASPGSDRSRLTEGVPATQFGLPATLWSPLGRPGDGAPAGPPSPGKNSVRSVDRRTGRTADRAATWPFPGQHDRRGAVVE